MPENMNYICELVDRAVECGDKAAQYRLISRLKDHEKQMLVNWCEAGANAFRTAADLLTGKLEMPEMWTMPKVGAIVHPSETIKNRFSLVMSDQG